MTTPGKNTDESRSDDASSTAEQQAHIIAQLCADAPNETVRNCLRKYDITKTEWQIETLLKKDRKDTLLETLTYLGLQDMSHYKVDSLRHELICRVQNLLPDTCHLCNQTYCISLADKPIMSCMRCGQGCHNSCVLQLMNISEGELNESNKFGADLVNPYAATGLFYICGHCQPEIVPQKAVLMCTKKGRGPAKNRSSASSSNTTVNADTETSPQDTENNDEVVNTSINEGGNNNDTPESAAPASIPATGGEAPVSTPALCKFYQHGRCKYGLSGRKNGTCAFSHPKPCKKFLNNGTKNRGGCTRGSDCIFHHPKVCHSSLQDRTCFREDCKYVHIRGTKRTAPPAAADINGNNPSRPAAQLRSDPSNILSRENRTPNNGTTGPAAPTISSRDNAFLEHLKGMQEQIVTISNKLSQMDVAYNSLLTQQTGFTPHTKFPTMPTHMGKQMFNFPMMYLPQMAAQPPMQLTSAGQNPLASC